MNSLYPPPPPPPPITTVNGAGGSTSNTIVVTQPQYSDINHSNADVIGNTSPSSPSPSPSSSIVIVIIVVASAIIVSTSIYLLLRFISRRYSRIFQTFPSTSADDVVTHNRNNNNANSTADCFDECRVTSNTLLDTLPLFAFGSVTGNLTGVECAVCLSKFETQDQLRLLPLCCHAFHARCIDTWLASNLTCPLCRSSVNPTDSDVFSKILPANDIGRNSNGNGNNNGGSFRIEIGSVSRRHGRSDSADGRRSYSIGSFEYIVDDGYEVSVDSTHRRCPSECTSVDKESLGVPIPAPPGESLAGEVAAGRSWLRDYVDRLSSFSFSSRTMSFRSSGRFFTGSSRRSDLVVPSEDLEANRMGEEISELFRWLSGV